MYSETDRLFIVATVALAYIIIEVLLHCKSSRDNTEERRLRKMRREQTLRDWL